MINLGNFVVSKFFYIFAKEKIKRYGQERTSAKPLPIRN